MRYVLLLTVVLVGGGIIYTLVAVGGELRRVSADLDTLTGDLGALTEDMNSIADDVNAIADAVAGESDEDETRSCPAPARDGRQATAARARRNAPQTAAPWRIEGGVRRAAHWTRAGRRPGW